MDDMQMIGLMVLFAGIIGGRVLSNNALEKLSSEQKVLILDAFAGIRKFSLVPLVVFLGGYFLLNHFLEFRGPLPQIAFFGVIFTYLLVSQVFVFRKLARLALPGEYMKSYMISQAVVMGGFVAWIGMTVYLVIVP